MLACILLAKQCINMPVLLPQVMTVDWHYGNSLNGLRKSGTPTYGTSEVWLLENIKEAQEAVGAHVDYQDWKNITLLQEPLPPFGLERLLPVQLNSDAGSDADSDAGALGV